VYGDNWQGLYIDGKLVDEHHRLEVSDVLKHLGIECEDIRADDEWLEDRGTLPKKLKDVKQE
jgi:hypothetical protein